MHTRGSVPDDSGEDGRAIAFAAAVDLLGPYPWRAAPRPLAELFRRSMPWLDLPDQVTRADIAKVLRVICDAHRDRLLQDRLSDRPKATLDRYARIEAMALALAKALADLDVSERHLLRGGFGDFLSAHVRDAHPHLPDRDAWSRMSQSMFSVLPGLDYAHAPPSPVAGRAETLLRDLAEYVAARRIALIDGDLDLGDRGGRTTLRRKISGTPTWRLVRDGFHLLQRVPVVDGGTRTPDLVALLQLIHEATTGTRREDDAYERAVKSYRKLFATYSTKQAELEARWPPLDLTDAELLALCAKYAQERDPTQPLAPPSEQLQLLLEVMDLQTKLLRGPTGRVRRPGRG